MKKWSNYIKKLLTNGSGTSIKSFLAFLVAIVGIAVVIWIDDAGELTSLILAAKNEIRTEIPER